jgi:hypothetical protein
MRRRALRDDRACHQRRDGAQGKAMPQRRYAGSGSAG